MSINEELSTGHSFYDREDVGSHAPRDMPVLPDQDCRHSRMAIG